MNNKMALNTKITLNNGVRMPVLGLGTWQITGKKAEETVLSALNIGYKHIDTATAYHNETDIGKALVKSGIPREEIFITTKLWNSDHGHDKAIAACEKSLKNLGLSYADLYLIHWPVANLYIKTWTALEELLANGKCRAIGVSNFTIRHLEALMRQSSTVPAVNQVEFSPYLYQKELLDYCRSKGIQLEAYSPLTRGNKLANPALSAIADKYGKSTAQILIRWSLQSGLVVIPKASSTKHLNENAGVFDFELSEEDMQTLNSFNENLHICWNPDKKA
ncbi:MAG: aldo/keto reductase [Dehalococcoidales bacterium]|nr:aldo/keto reductase [Dehalococcoidales bacterium]